MQEQLSNIFKEAQKALTDDLRQNFYNAVNNRTTAFRQLNQKANYNHSLFSGAAKGQQMAYDRDTLLPNTATMAQQAISRQMQNQESWNEYMDYVKQLNQQAAEYAKNASQMNSIAEQYSKNSSANQ